MMKSDALTLALAALLFATLLYVSNFAYGLSHESAHALLVKAFGGTVYDIYVNPFGMDAFTSHSTMSGIGFLIVELAGMGMTTIIAIILTAVGRKTVPAIFALRTLIYALDYTQGTDISNVQAALGNQTFVITVILVAINLASIACALRGRIMLLLKDFSASLSRGHPERNSGE